MCSFVVVKRVKRVEISAVIPGAASVCVLVCTSKAVVKQVNRGASRVAAVKLLG